MNTKTQTITTEGYPEAGPFETQSEAMGAFVPTIRYLVLSVELREDGWYRTYVVNSTTSTIDYYEPETRKPKRLDAKCWEFARNIFHGRKIREG